MSGWDEWREEEGIRKPCSDQILNLNELGVIYWPIGTEKAIKVGHGDFQLQ